MSDPSDPGRVPPAGGSEAPPVEAPPPSEPPTPPRRRRPALRYVLGGAALLLLLAATAAALVNGLGDDGDGPRSRTRTSSERMIELARSQEDPEDIAVPDPERPGDLGDDPLLDRLADECFEGDPSSCDDLFRESALGSDYEKYGSTCGERTKGGQSGGCAALYPDPDYDELRRRCAGGDDTACDDLYNFAPRESVDEHFGSTCGGRSEDQLVGACAARGEAESP